MGNLIIQIFSILIQAIVELCILLTLSKIISRGEKYNNKQISILCATLIINSFLSKLIYYLEISYINSVISAIIELLLLRFVLKQSWKNSILIEIICIAILAISEISAVSTYIIISGKEISEINASIIYSSILSVFVNFVAFMITYIAKIITTKKLSFAMPNLTNKNILVLLCSSIIYILPQMILFISNEYNYSPILLILNCIQFIVINIFTFFFLKKDMAYQKSRSDLITSEVHNKTLIGMIDGVRTLKHDYNNIIQALNGYIVTKQYDKLEEHIKSLLKECNGINNISSIDPKVFNDPAIYGIVGSKYFLANEKGIPFEFDITTNIAELEFPKPELSRIMGILLDNAIEATTKCDNPYIRLQIRFDNRKCADLIKIYNTYDKSINIDLEKIFKKGYSSKEVKSGIGLWEVKKLVKQNSNSQIYASIEGEMFVQNIVIER